MTSRRPFTLSFVGHAMLVLLVLTIDLHSVAAKRDAAQRVAVHAHEAKYQQTVSVNYAERLKRIRQLVERLDSEEGKNTTEKGLPSPTEPPPSPPTPAEHTPPGTPPKPQPDIAQLWQESRKEYDVVKERYIELKAKKLAALTHVDVEKARQQVQEELQGNGSSRGLGKGEGPPSDAAAAAAGIAGMHADAQRMLRETLRNAGGGSQGQPLDMDRDTAREVSSLSQNQMAGMPTAGREDVVDWTPFMTSRVARVNSILDTSADQQRLEATKNADLRLRYHQTRKEVRFTRRLGGADAVAGAWATPDAWYVIGPFPNPRRENIETSYPPEMEIDRDAVYEGRNGRVVSWRYIRPRRPNVRPPDMEDFAVYYAYTEVTCVAATDCWLAIGSDDYSKLWVNGFLVWHGSKNEKEWSPTEGFRRVHLDAGVNRFLVRLENGINGCEFSVLIALE